MIIKILSAAMSAVLLSLPIRIYAQQKIIVHGNIDFVSDYIWRGADQHSGFSIQPSLTLGYAGFGVNVWCNQTLSRWNVDPPAKEFDINLSYAYENFSVTISDYWWAGVDKPYGHYKNSHFFEGSLAYCLGDSFPLTFSWSTMFAGADKNEKGNLQGSTYINASYPVQLAADITLTPSVGFTPWKGYYHETAALTDLSLKANKEIRVSENVSAPLFIQAIVAPAYDRTYLVAGFGLKF